MEKKVIFPVLFPMTANQLFLLIWIWKNQRVCKTITIHQLFMVASSKQIVPL